MQNKRAGLKTEYRKRALILTPSLFYLSARNVSFLNNKINAAIVIIIVNNPKETPIAELLNLLYDSNLENSSANNILREHKPLIKHIVFNFL